MVSFDNLRVDITISDLYLEDLLMEILLFATRMAQLTRVRTYVDNTMAQGW